MTTEETKWQVACRIDDIPQDGGACVLINDQQVAIFNFARRNEWFATQNLCPHKQQMALARGMVGSHESEAKVACPFHKKTFSLESGKCLSGDDYEIKTYPIKIENAMVWILL